MRQHVGKGRERSVPQTGWSVRARHNVLPVASHDPQHKEMLSSLELHVTKIQELQWSLSLSLRRVLSQLARPAANLATL